MVVGGSKLFIVYTNSLYSRYIRQDHTILWIAFFILDNITNLYYTIAPKAYINSKLIQPKYLVENNKWVLALLKIYHLVENGHH